MGSGTTALAACNLERNSVGYEINKNFRLFYEEKVVRINKNVNNTFDMVEDTAIIDLNHLYKTLPYKFVDVLKLNKLVDVRENTYGSKFETDKYCLENKGDLFDAITLCKQKEEPIVLVNHARTELRQLMIQKGICYLRAGDSKGSVLVQPGFERMQYVLLHTAGNAAQLFKLKAKGKFQIWTKETLIEKGFNPHSSPYYIVLHFDNQHPIKTTNMPNLKEDKNTYRAKIKKLSEFVSPM